MQGTWRRHHSRYPSHVTTFSTILIVMISIAVIAAAIGTTELLFEFLDRYHRTKNDRNHCKSSSLWSTDGTPQGLQRAQRLQAQPDEAGDVDARLGGSRATWASGTSPSTDSMTRLTASNDGFHLEGSQPFETNDHLIYDGEYSSERGQITEVDIQECRVKLD